MGSCDRGSAVVRFEFMVLVCGGGLFNDGGEAMVVDLWVVMVFFLGAI